MRRVIFGFAVGLSSLGCGSQTPGMPGNPVPLRIAEDVSVEQCCLLSFVVMDVEAAPTFGTLNKATDEPLTWPRGYAARWAGFEVEVLDPTGRVVLTTGGRYWLSPVHTPSFPGFVVGMVKPCPGCELGGGPR